MIIYVYSDASYHHQSKMSACGFLICTDNKIIKHEVNIVSNIDTCNESEAYAASLGLVEAYLFNGVKEIKLFTDSLIVVKIISEGNKKKHSKVYNELTEVLSACDEAGIAISVKKVKAHSNHNRNNIIDNSVRKYLRIALTHVCGSY